jgi:TIR domain
MSVFISHSRVNSSMALRLSDELHKRNVETWLDLRDLTTGKDWESEVSSAIRSAAGFVFVIGPAGPSDRWQTFEWQQIVENEYYLDPSKPLIPVLIGEPEMPGFLKTRHRLVLDETPSSFGDVADQIVNALQNPSTSVDEEKLELGRQARKRALESLREYTQILSEEDIKRAGLRTGE